MLEQGFSEEVSYDRLPKISPARLQLSLSLHRLISVINKSVPMAVSH